MYFSNLRLIFWNDFTKTAPFYGNINFGVVKPGPRNVSLFIPYLNTLQGTTSLGMNVRGPVELGTYVLFYI